MPSASLSPVNVTATPACASEVFPPESVAVAVTSNPAGTAMGKVVEMVAFPLPFVFTFA